MNTIGNTLLGLMGMLAASLVAAGSHIMEIHAPWIQEAPPSARVLAAYMTLKNAGDKSRTLTGASSLAFEKVEMHQSKITDGMARMVRRKKLEIPPHGQVEFRPGGYHFMLIGKKRPLRAGERVALTLMFADGREITVTTEVRKPMGHDSAGHNTGTKAHRH